MHKHSQSSYDIPGVMLVAYWHRFMFYVFLYRGCFHVSIFTHRSAITLASRFGLIQACSLFFYRYVDRMLLWRENIWLYRKYGMMHSLPTAWNLLHGNGCFVETYRLLRQNCKYLVWNELIYFLLVKRDFVENNYRWMINATNIKIIPRK